MRNAWQKLWYSVTINPISLADKNQYKQTNKQTKEEVGFYFSIIYRTVADFPRKPSDFGKVKVAVNMPTLKGINSESIKICRVSYHISFKP